MILDILIRAIAKKIGRRKGVLAGALAGAKPAEKEVVLAELEYCDWLEDCCCETFPER
jgi:hypothetical protein